MTTPREPQPPCPEPEAARSDPAPAWLDDDDDSILEAAAWPIRDAERRMKGLPMLDPT